MKYNILQQVFIIKFILRKYIIILNLNMMFKNVNFKVDIKLIYEHSIILF